MSQILTSCITTFTDIFLCFMDDKLYYAVIVHISRVCLWNKT